MAESEEEDLTRFGIEELLAVVDDVATSIERNKSTKEQAEKLRKVAEELRRRNSEELQQSGASATPHPAKVGFAKRSLEREVPSRTKNLKPPGGRS
jgi:hypothetical protein